MFQKSDQYRIYDPVYENNTRSEFVIYSILSGKGKIHRKSENCNGKMFEKSA